MRLLVFFSPQGKTGGLFRLYSKIEYRDIEVPGHGVFRVIHYPAGMGNFALSVYRRRVLPLIRGAALFGEAPVAAGGIETVKSDGTMLSALNLNGILSSVFDDKSLADAKFSVTVKSASQLGFIEELVRRTKNIYICAPADICGELDDMMLEHFGIAGSVYPAGGVSNAGKIVIFLPGVLPQKAGEARMVFNFSGNRSEMPEVTPNSVRLTPPPKLRPVCEIVGCDAATMETLVGYFGLSVANFNINSVKIDKQQRYAT